MHRGIAPLTFSSLFASLLLVSACDDDRQVPFGLHPNGHATTHEPSTGESPVFEARAASDIPRGQKRRIVAGAELATTDLELGSILEVDFDDDRDLDALVVLRSDSVAELALASRDGQSYSLARLSRAALPEGCVAGAAQIEQPGERTIIARLRHT